MKLLAALCDPLSAGKGPVFCGKSLTKKAVASVLTSVAEF